MEQSADNTDFRRTIAETFQDKLNVLEERDKYLRQVMSKYQKNDRLRGICPDMCPEKERLLRELRCSFSIYESTVVGNERHVVPELLIKEYARSSADQDTPLSHELRPEPVLTMTMEYVIENIMSQFESSSENVEEWYNFCWDRLRSIRKDIIQQQLCNKKVVAIIEQCARFHIWCYDAFCGQDKNIFEDKMNTENLVNCLQLLTQMYDDLGRCNIFCENEAEFRVYMALLQLNDADIMWMYLKYYKDFRIFSKMEEVGEIYLSFNHIIYSKFFSLVEKTSYLNACILMRYFNNFRTKALKVFVDSHCPGNKTVKFQLSRMQDLLKFDSLEETSWFLEKCGFIIDQTNEVAVCKAQFYQANIELLKSCELVKSKRLPLVEVMRGKKILPKSSSGGHKVHSSFSMLDTLNEDAFDTTDQKKRLLNIFKDYNPNEDNLLSIYARKKSKAIILHYEEPEEGEILSENENDEDTNSFGSDFSPRVERFGIVNSDCDEDAGMVSMSNKHENNSEELFDDQKMFEIREEPIEILGLQKSPKDVSPKSPKAVFFRSDFQFSAVSSNDRHSFDNSNKNTQNEEHEILSPIIQSPCSTHTFSTDQGNTYDIDSESLTESDYIEKNNYTNPEINFNEQVNQFVNNMNQLKSEINDMILSAYLENKNRKENQKLRRVVKRNLRKANALKYGKLWQNKVKKVIEKRSNLVDITHLSVDEHLKLWGKHDHLISDSVCKRAANLITMTKKVNGILNSNAGCPYFMGNTLADELSSAILDVKSNLKTDALFWKGFISFPNVQEPNFDYFVQKLKELCQLSCYKDQNVRLGDVECWYTSTGIRILISLSLKRGMEELENLHGLSGVGILLSEKWESFKEVTTRINTIINNASPSRFPLVLSIMDKISYEDNLFVYLKNMKKRRIITDFYVIKWNNFYTIMKMITALCQLAPVLPVIKVEWFNVLLEDILTDFFTTLSDCSTMYNENMPRNSPNTAIKLYNSFLLKFKNILLEKESNVVVPKEFISRLKPNKKPEALKNNLLHRDYICSVINTLQLPYFKKWPPESAKKMVKSLSTYCNILDNTGLLLPNVLRIINPSSDWNVTDINTKPPWNKTVEIWVKYKINKSNFEDENIQKIILCCKFEDIYKLRKQFWDLNVDMEVD